MYNLADRGLVALRHGWARKVTRGAAFHALAALAISVSGWAKTPTPQATVPGPTVPQQVLLQKEKQFWDYLKIKNVTALGNLIADDAVIYYEGTPRKKDEYLKLVAGLAFRPFSTSDFRVTLVSAETAQVESLFSGTDPGAARPPTRFRVTSTWVRRGGDWLLTARLAAPVEAAPERVSTPAPKSAGRKQAARRVPVRRRPRVPKLPLRAAVKAASPGDELRPLTSAEAQREMREIQSLLQAQVNAWNHGDVEGFLKGYRKSPTTVFAGPEGIYRGWQTALERYRKAYSDPKMMGSLTYSNVEIVFLGRNAASIVGRWRLLRQADRSLGIFTLVVRKFPEGWQIINDNTEVVEGR